MKRISLLVAMFALFLTLGAASAMAQNIVVANGTDFTIQQLGLVDSSANGEAEDLLGSEILAPGEGLEISLSGGSKGWELIAVDAEGNQVNWQNLDLTGVKKVTLKANGDAILE